MAKPELCRHDIELVQELQYALFSAAGVSREAVKTRTRDIDRLTERMLRRTVEGRRIGVVRIGFREDSLKELKAFVLGGPYGTNIGIVFDTKLSVRERNKLTMHFLGLVATGHLGSISCHIEPDLNGEQAEADDAATQWVRDVVGHLSTGRYKGSIFVRGIERALAS